MQPTSCFLAKDLKNFILRKLGAPVIKIEITEQQIYDCISRALELYGEYHYDGVNKTYYTIKLTKEQARSGLIDLRTENIFAVTEILRTNTNLAMGIGGGTVYTWFLDFVTQIANGPAGTCSGYGANSLGNNMANLGYFSSLMSYKLSMEKLMDPIPDYTFNGTNKTLHVFKNLSEGDIIILEAYVFSFLQIDMSENTVNNLWLVGGLTKYNNEENQANQIINALNKMFMKDQAAYNVRWVKNYATCLTKEIWGQILGKFPITLPGGITTNGDRLINEALAEKEKLETELYDMVAPPPIRIG